MEPFPHPPTHHTAPGGLGRGWGGAAGSRPPRRGLEACGERGVGAWAGGGGAGGRGGVFAGVFTRSLFFATHSTIKCVSLS